MKVTVAALLSVRRQVGWSQREMEVSGSTVADLLSQIKLSTNGANLYKVLIQEDGTPKPKYRFALNQQIIDKEALGMDVQEGDRLVAMDAIHVPSLAC